jgi:hypothetical protein
MRACTTSIIHHHVFSDPAGDAEVVGSGSQRRDCLLYPSPSHLLHCTHMSLTSCY